MWAFTTHGFLSIVQHNAMPDHFQVKARVPDPLENLWPDHEIEVIDWADYRYRITIEKSEVLPVLLEAIASVNYTSFKDFNEAERIFIYNYFKNSPLSYNLFLELAGLTPT